MHDSAAPPVAERDAPRAAPPSSPSLAAGAAAPRWSAWQWLRYLAAALAVALVHAGLLQFFGGFEVYTDARPLSFADFDTHIHQTWRVIEALDGWGRTWVYDPKFLAGHPTATIFDADNKLWELWTWALHRAGLAKGRAFNLYVLTAHLAVPLAVGVAARLFRVGPWGALAAAAMASALWWFDSIAHWCWWVGMVAYGTAGTMYVIPLALFFRFLDSRRLGWAGACAVALGLAHLNHPYSFTILVWPMVAMYVAAAPRLRPRDHAAVVAIAIVTIAMNVYWLWAAFFVWHYILDSAFYGQAGLDYLVADYLGLLLDTATTGALGTRSAFRVLFGGLGVAMMVLWWRERDPRALPFIVTAVAMFLLTYLGTYSPLFAQIQPYRHALPLTFVGVIPAAALLERAVAQRWDRQLGTKGKALAAILALPASQHVASDIVYFTPSLLPTPAPLSNGDPAPLSATGYGPHLDYRHFPPLAWDPLVAWLDAHDRGYGRVLVEIPQLGEQLAWKSRSAIIGGFLHRNLEHSYANLFRRYPQGIVDPDVLDAYLERYAIEFVVVSSAAPWWDTYTGSLELVGRAGPHRIYRSKRPISLVAEGSAARVEAATNTIRVRGSDPDRDLVLRFHWMETLACRPDCTIERVPLPDQNVGFIRVPAPHPADFTIGNTYARKAAIPPELR